MSFKGHQTGILLTETRTKCLRNIHMFSANMSHVMCFWSHHSFHLPGSQRTKRNKRSSRRQRPDWGEGECGRHMCPIHHILWLCVFDLQRFLFLYSREKMEPQETALSVVMVSRYDLQVVHVSHVHVTLYSKHLCLF